MSLVSLHGATASSAGYNGTTALSPIGSLVQPPAPLPAQQKSDTKADQKIERSGFDHFREGFTGVTTLEDKTLHDARPWSVLVFNGEELRKKDFQKMVRIAFDEFMFPTKPVTHFKDLRVINILNANDNEIAIIVNEAALKWPWIGTHFKHICIDVNKCWTGEASKRALEALKTNVVFKRLPVKIFGIECGNERSFLLDGKKLNVINPLEAIWFPYFTAEKPDVIHNPTLSVFSGEKIDTKKDDVTWAHAVNDLIDAQRALPEADFSKEIENIRKILEDEYTKRMRIARRNPEKEKRPNLEKREIQWLADTIAPKIVTAKLAIANALLKNKLTKITSELPFRLIPANMEDLCLPFSDTHPDFRKQWFDLYQMYLTDLEEELGLLLHEQSQKSVALPSSIGSAMQRNQQVLDRCQIASDRCLNELEKWKALTKDLKPTVAEAL